MIICLQRGAGLHMAQMTPLLLTVSFFSKIQIGFTFLLPAHLGSPGKMAVKRGVCVCVCSLSKMLTVTDQKPQKITERVILLTMKVNVMLSNITLVIS